MKPRNNISLSTSYVKKLLSDYLDYRYRHDKGSICSFSISKLLRFHGIEMEGGGVTLATVLRYYLNALVQLGFVKAEKVHGRNGQCWKYFIKRHDIPKIIEVLKQL